MIISVTMIVIINVDTSSGGASEAEDGGEQHASVRGERPPGSLAQLRRTGAGRRAETDRATAGTRFISSFIC